MVKHPRPPDDTLWKCTACEETKLATEFKAEGKVRRGLSNRCRVCENAQHRKSYRYARYLEDRKQARITQEGVFEPNPADANVSWLPDAACGRADPALFDSCRKPAEALSYCRVCPVVQECLDRVRPSDSYYSGIAGNQVWVEGKPRG